MVPSPEEWLRAFSRASYVFTDSFHGSVFSLIFQKPFIAIGNRKRGLERFHSLFGKFGLDDRLIYDINGYSPDLLKRQIDWSEVAAIFDEDRKRAVDCLSSVLY